jgi:hypothetical protein
MNGLKIRMAFLYFNLCFIRLCWKRPYIKSLPNIHNHNLQLTKFKIQNYHKWQQFFNFEFTKNVNKFVSIFRLKNNLFLEMLHMPFPFFVSRCFVLQGVFFRNIIAIFPSHRVFPFIMRFINRDFLHSAIRGLSYILILFIVSHILE